MKKLILFSTFFFSISVHALPNCPLDNTTERWGIVATVKWDNCFSPASFPNGDKYVGEWKDGKYHGQGTYTYANGDEYVGEYKDGKYHGQGTLTFANGDEYVGGWKDNKVHGQGTYTFSDGERRIVGYFMNGEYIPEICEGMGLVKGTESFGNCVNNLIDDL